MILTATILVGSASFVSITGQTKAIAKEYKNTDKEDALENIVETVAGVNSMGDGDYDKEETVFVISDASGNPTEMIASEWLKNLAGSDKIEDSSSLKDIVNVKGYEEYKAGSGDSLTWDAKGNDIYYQGTPTEESPVGVKVSYKLDGKTVTPDEIKGKSGHVEIRFDYENNTDEVIEVGGEEEHVSLPFTMLTGVILPNDIFSNVEVENGRLITEGNNAIVIGYAFPGLYESLKYDDFKENLDEEQREKAEDLDISDHVIITADAKDFELNSTLTVALPDVLEEVSFTDNIDTDKVKDDMDELADASQELIDGTGDLVDGVYDLKDGTSELKDGTEELKDGTSELKDGTRDLKDGTEDLVDGTQDLMEGAWDMREGACEAYGGTKKLYDGTKKLKNGAGEAYDGSKTLYAGIGQAYEGSKQLDTGVNQVSSLLTSKSTEIKQLETLATLLASSISSTTATGATGAVGMLGVNLVAVNANESSDIDIQSLMSDLADDPDTTEYEFDLAANTFQSNGDDEDDDEYISSLQDQIDLLDEAIKKLEGLQRKYGDQIDKLSSEIGDLEDKIKLLDGYDPVQFKIADDNADDTMDDSAEDTDNNDENVGDETSGSGSEGDTEDDVEAQDSESENEGAEEGTTREDTDDEAVENSRDESEAENPYKDKYDELLGKYNELLSSLGDEYQKEIESKKETIRTLSDNSADIEELSVSLNNVLDSLKEIADLTENDENDENSLEWDTYDFTGGDDYWNFDLGDIDGYQTISVADLLGEGDPGTEEMLTTSMTATGLSSAAIQGLVAKFSAMSDEEKVKFLVTNTDGSAIQLVGAILQGDYDEETKVKIAALVLQASSKLRGDSWKTLIAYSQGAVAKAVSSGVTELTSTLTSTKTQESIAKLTAGAGSLETGLGTIYVGSGTLSSGLHELYDGTKELKDGAHDLRDGMSELSNGGVELYDGTVDLHDGAIDLDDGAGDLNDGANDLDDGAADLDDGVGELNDGADELVDGAKELHDGMIEFNDEGIQKLIDLFGDNVTDMLDRLDAIQKTGSGYQSFSGKRDDMEGSVKFILKTGEIKAED